MLLIPILLAAGLLIAVGRHSVKSTKVPVLAQGAPSPIAVLDSFVKRGQTPPPDVILAALAEAEAIGRMDVAGAILETFVIPVVEANEGGPTNMIVVPPVAPRTPRGTRPPVHPPQHAQPPTREYDEGQAMPIDGDETEAALRMMEDMARRERGESMPGSEPPVIAAGAIAYGEIDLPSAPMTIAQGTTRIKSPIPDIDPASWSSFVDSLVREPVTFMSARHVGQFRHRMDRLIELGVDPQKIVGNGERQIVALERDMADAYRHAKRSGMLDDNVDARIEIPIKGATPQTHEVTASGVLGVIQAAGLEGAAEWFDRPGDRVRFPHTTQAFLRTNGVF